MRNHGSAVHNLQERHRKLKNKYRHIRARKVTSAYIPLNSMLCLSSAEEFTIIYVELL